MPPKSRDPGEGQQAIFGPDLPVGANVDPGRPRNSLARALTAEYMGLQVNDFMDITTTMVALAQPDELRKHLIDVPLNIEISPFAVSFTDPRTHRERNIALTPLEAKTVPRFVGALQRHAVIGSAAKTAGYPQPSDRARQARSKVHIQEEKLSSCIAYKASLEKHLGLLDKFVVASDGSNIGLSMFGPEVNLRAEIAYFQSIITSEMVHAYGEQQRLPASSMRMVEKTITWNMFFHPDKFSYFHGFTKLLREYNGDKLELVSQRVSAMQRNIGRSVVPRT